MGIDPDIYYKVLILDDLNENFFMDRFQFRNVVMFSDKFDVSMEYEQTREFLHSFLEGLLLLVQNKVKLSNEISRLSQVVRQMERLRDRNSDVLEQARPGKKQQLEDTWLVKFQENIKKENDIHTLLPPDVFEILPGGCTSRVMVKVRDISAADAFMSENEDIFVVSKNP
jgi:hypothetical protein